MIKLINSSIITLMVIFCTNSSEQARNTHLPNYAIIKNIARKDTLLSENYLDTVEKSFIIPIQKSKKISIPFFELALEEVKAMLKGSEPQSLKKAVFTIENAWYNGNLSYAAFDNQLQTILNHMQEIVVQKGIGNYKTAGNWAAHTFLSKPIMQNNMQPYVYDFDDFTGRKDYTKMFVTKLLSTKSGNCHSLPLLYKILTDEFGAESFLALAPNHLYIKHRDENRRWFNLELTNGHFSTDAWIISSSHIKSEAIQSKIYMAALTQSESIAMCLTDLAAEYIAKYGYGVNDSCNFHRKI